MTTIPVRGIAQYGVIADAASTDIPAGAWTMARNARFVGSRIRRAPVYRTLLSSLSTTAPYFLGAASPQSAPDGLFYTDRNGRIYRRLTTGLATDVTAALHVNTDTSLPVSMCSISEYTIINRSTEQPWCLAPAGTQFEVMPGWNSSHSAVVVRQFKDYLVALNVTKYGTNNPYLVKTSDGTAAGSMPTSWDHTDPTNLATENVINELTTALVDGETLGDEMLLYSSDQVWRMSYRGDEFIFEYRNTTIKGGVINPNCIVKAEGLHFVFGTNDIYAHDGVTQSSIADERCRDYVFGYIDRTKVDRCFTSFDERLSTVRFFFNSSHPDLYWQNATHCNASVSYNIKNKTWQFEDQPNVVGAALANSSTVYTYATYAGTYATATETFATVSETTWLVPILGTAQMSGAGSAPSISARIYVHDLLGTAAIIPGLAVDTVITPPVVLQKTYVDLDDLGLALLDYKELQRVVPQMSVTGTATFQFRAGYQVRLNKAITWDAYIAYDPENDDSVDFMDATTGCYPGGKLISLEVKFSSLSEDFAFTAYDIDIISTGHK